MAKSKDRIMWLEKYDHYYRFHHLFSTMKCIYCGQPKQHIDHTPPLSWVDANGSDYFIKNQIPFYKVPSCKDCNVILGDKPFFTIRQRKGYVAATLRERFAKELQNPMWDSEEMYALGDTLRSYIDVMQGSRLVLERRLDYATSD